MQKDLLADLVTTIEKDCNDNNIEVIYGSIDENVSCPLRRVELDLPDWARYLKMLKALRARVIIISQEKNDIENFDDIKARAQRTEGDEQRKQLIQGIRRVEKTTGMVAAISIHFIQDFLHYEFFEQAEWYADYCLVEIASDEDDDEVGDDDSERSEIEYSDEQVEELARKLISRPAFLKAINDRERKNVLWAMPETEAIKPWSSRTQVIARAQEIFATEIYPIQEKKLNREIHDKKRQGYKKVQVKGMLNISENTINRHWYREFEGA